jgi:hypothetical protein
LGGAAATTFALLLCALGDAAPAHADAPATTVAVEAGAEIDSNPERIATGAGASPRAAAVARGGARLDLSWRPATRRALALTTVAAAKKFLDPSTPGAAEEDVAVIALDGRFDAALASRPVALGVRLSYYDAFERTTAGGADDHDFRTGDAALALTLRGENEQRVSLVAGVRAFQYKPDSRYDFAGEHVQLLWKRTLSTDGAEDDVDEAATWSIAADAGVARRAYDDRARVNLCPPGAPLNTGCLSSTDLTRVDVVYSGGIGLGYAGERLWAARYELQATLSNSFGQSLVRHRVELSGTSELGWSVFATARLVVQVNQFLDPLLLSRDIGLLTIEDENRNSLSLHLTRDLGPHLAVEARATLATNEFATEELRYRRMTGYAGVVYRR